MDVFSVVRQAVMAYLEGASGLAPRSVLPHTPGECLGVVMSHASPRAQRHLAVVFTRLDGLLTRQGHSRLWFVAETLAVWAAKAEPRVEEASVLGSKGGLDA
jgi:hypothetical protein